MRSSREEQARQHIFSDRGAADAAAESQPVRELNQLIDTEEKAAIAEWRQYFDFRADAEERFPAIKLNKPQSPDRYIEWRKDLKKQRSELLLAIQLLSIKRKPPKNGYLSFYYWLIQPHPIIIIGSVFVLTQFLYYILYKSFVMPTRESRLSEICSRTLDNTSNYNITTKFTTAKCDNYIYDCATALACHLITDAKNRVILNFVEPIQQITTENYCKKFDLSLKDDCGGTYYPVSNWFAVRVSAFLTAFLVLLSFITNLVFVSALLAFKNPNRYASMNIFKQAAIAPVLTKHHIHPTLFSNRTDVLKQLYAKTNEDSHVGYAIQEAQSNPRSRLFHLRNNVCENVMNLIFDSARDRLIMPENTTIANVRRM